MRRNYLKRERKTDTDNQTTRFSVKEHKRLPFSHPQRRFQQLQRAHERSVREREERRKQYTQYAETAQKKEEELLAQMAQIKEEEKAARKPTLEEYQAYLKRFQVPLTKLVSLLPYETQILEFEIGEEWNIRVERTSTGLSLFCVPVTDATRHIRFQQDSTSAFVLQETVNMTAQGFLQFLSSLEGMQLHSGLSQLNLSGQ